MLRTIWQQLQLPCTEQPSLELHNGYKGRSPRAGHRPARPSMRAWFMARQLDWISETARQLYAAAGRLYEIWETASAGALMATPARDGARSVPVSRRSRLQRRSIAIWHARRAVRQLAWCRYRTAMATYETFLPNA